MTSTPVSNLAQAHGPPVLISKTGKLWIGILGLLMIGFHWHFISRMARIGMGDADWSHVLIIPLISIYYIHLHRQRLMATPRRVCLWGLPFIVAGIAGYVLGIFPIQNDMAMGYSMIMTLFGIVLLLLGPAMMRTLWFPILFMVFAVKVSDAIWSQVASKMQAMAAHGAVLFINLSSPLTDMHATLRGSTIDLDYSFKGTYVVEAMNVAEACAGMRMLMAFLALGVALAFLFPRRWWQRLIMVALAAPIAIFVNALRVAVLGWLHLINPDLAHGDFHLFVGMLMLIPAAGLLMLVGWCLDKILIVEGKPPRPPAPLPFDDDPNQIHFDRSVAIKGAGIGAVVVAMLALSYILLINRLTGHDIIAWLGAGPNAILLGVTTLLFVGGLIWAWLSIHRGNRTHQLALSQGVVGGLLLVAVAAQYGMTASSKVALNKKPVELRHGLVLEFPDEAGDWVRLYQDPKLPKDIEDELGTKQYFNSYYINRANGYTKDNVQAITKSSKTGEQLASWKGIEEPGQIAKVHMTYYTGMLDTVPHVPDKCWIVAGNQLVDRKEHTLTLSRDDYRPDPDHPGLILATSEGFDQTVRLPSYKGRAVDKENSDVQIKAIIFSGASEDGHITSALYFFLANGDAIASSHNVRFSFNLKDRYSYFSKVEVMFPGVNDPEQIAAYAEDLLKDLMPEIMACLPDWTEVQAGTYPKPAE